LSQSVGVRPAWFELWSCRVGSVHARCSAHRNVLDSGTRCRAGRLKAVLRLPEPRDGWQGAAFPRRATFDSDGNGRVRRQRSPRAPASRPALVSRLGPSRRCRALRVERRLLCELPECAVDSRGRRELTGTCTRPVLHPTRPTRTRFMERFNRGYREDVLDACVLGSATCGALSRHITRTIYATGGITRLGVKCKAVANRRSLS